MLTINGFNNHFQQDDANAGHSNKLTTCSHNSNWPTAGNGTQQQ